MHIVWALLLIALACGCWVLTLLNLPGNWGMVGITALYVWLAPVEETSFGHLGWTAVIILAVLALLGELLELGAGALGTARGGGSKRGAVLAVLGSVVGSVVGAVFATPFVPTIVGAVVVLVLCAGLGALGGAMLGEAWKGRSLNESWRVGKAAFWGRLLGTLAKVMVASTMVVAIVVALIF